MIAVPATILLMLLSELWSGIALDSWWRASYPKGNWQYLAVLASQAVVFFIFSLIAYIMIQL
jgi:hypothetical protein